jgi:hypothetical protein
VSLRKQVSSFAELSAGDLADLASRMRPGEADAGTIHHEPLAEPSGVPP